MTTATTEPRNRSSNHRKRLNAEYRKQLEHQLLQLGGNKVVWAADDPYLTLVAQHGQHFTLPVHLQPGLPNEDTWNAAVLWASDCHGSQQMIGYALDQDGSWRSHRWIMKGSELIEPTEEKRAYFGIVLRPGYAMELCDEAVFEAMGFFDASDRKADGSSAC